MNSNQVIEILNEICNKLGIAVDWTSENVLPQIKIVCEKFIRYRIVQKSIMCGWGILFVFIGIVYGIILLRLYRRCKTTGNENFLFGYFNNWNSKNKRIEFQPYICILNAVVLAIVIVGIILLAVGLSALIKCLIAPEMVIADYFKDMIIGGTKINE